MWEDVYSKLIGKTFSLPFLEFAITVVFNIQKKRARGAGYSIRADLICIRRPCMVLWTNFFWQYSTTVTLTPPPSPPSPLTTTVHRNGSRENCASVSGTIPVRIEGTYSKSLCVYSFQFPWGATVTGLLDRIAY